MGLDLLWVLSSYLGLAFLTGSIWVLSLKFRYNIFALFKWILVDALLILLDTIYLQSWLQLSLLMRLLGVWRQFIVLLDVVWCAYLCILEWSKQVLVQLLLLSLVSEHATLRLGIGNYESLVKTILVCHWSIVDSFCLNSHSTIESFTWLSFYLSILKLHRVWRLKLIYVLSINRTIGTSMSTWTFVWHLSLRVKAVAHIIHLLAVSQDSACHVDMDTLFPSLWLISVKVTYIGPRTLSRLLDLSTSIVLMSVLDLFIELPGQVCILVVVWYHVLWLGTSEHFFDLTTISPFIDWSCACR